MWSPLENSSLTYPLIGDFGGKRVQWAVVGVAGAEVDVSNLWCLIVDESLVHDDG